MGFKIAHVQFDLMVGKPPEGRRPGALRKDEWGVFRVFRGRIDLFPKNYQHSKRNLRKTK